MVIIRAYRILGPDAIPKLAVINQSGQWIQIHLKCFMQTNINLKFHLAYQIDNLEGKMIDISYDLHPLRYDPVFDPP